MRNTFGPIKKSNLDIQPKPLRKGGSQLPDKIVVNGKAVQVETLFNTVFKTPNKGIRI